MVTSQAHKVITGHKRNDWIVEKNEEMQNSTSKEYRELIALREARRKRYLNSTNKNLDELLKNELNHEEPP